MIVSWLRIHKFSHIFFKSIETSLSSIPYSLTVRWIESSLFDYLQTVMRIQWILTALVTAFTGIELTDADSETTPATSDLPKVCLPLELNSCDYEKDHCRLLPIENSGSFVVNAENGTECSRTHFGKCPLKEASGLCENGCTLCSISEDSICQSDGKNSYRCVLPKPRPSTV